MYDPYCGKCGGGGGTLPPTFRSPQYGSIESHGISVGYSIGEGPYWFQLRTIGGSQPKVFWTITKNAVFILRGTSDLIVYWLDYWDGTKYIPVAMGNSRSVKMLI